VSENGIKLGQLLCDEDVITKRQLSKALQEQVKGRKGTLGEILVDMGVCTFEDITDAMMNHSSDTQKHEEKHEEIHKEPIPVPQPVVEVKPKPVVEEPKKEEPIELSEDKVMGTKFTMSLQTISCFGWCYICWCWWLLYVVIRDRRGKTIFQNHHPSNLYLVMSIHLSPMVITGRGLMNNTNHK